MLNPKELFLNTKIRSGGFYELSIQVCSNKEIEPIRKYTDYIWSQKNVEGPFDDTFNMIPSNTDDFRYDGILLIDEFVIPFQTFNISVGSEPFDSNEVGYNWFDISFYTETISAVFGDLYKNNGDDRPTYPKQLNDYFKEIASQLYKLHPFLLATVDFEVSGDFPLHTLKNKIENWIPSMFFVGQENYELIAEENRKYVTIVN